MAVNVASNRFAVAVDLVGVLCTTLLALSVDSPFGSVVCDVIWGDGEAIAFLGDGLDGRTSGKFCEDTLPFGRCRGATLVPSSV